MPRPRRRQNVHFPTDRDDPADLTVTLTRPQLLAMLGGAGPDGLQMQGDRGVLTTILQFADEPDTGFAIVIP